MPDSSSTRLPVNTRERATVTAPQHDYYVTADNDLVLTMQLDDDVATSYPDHANVTPVEPVDPEVIPEDA